MIENGLRYFRLEICEFGLKIKGIKLVISEERLVYIVYKK